MRRSVLAVVLTVFAALLASLFSSPTAAVQPAGIGYGGTDTGNFYTSPDTYFEGEKIKLTANFPSEAGSLEVTYYKETSPGSDDYASIGTDDANSYGNAYLTNYQVDAAQKVFARTSDGDVTELHALEPKTVEPGSCAESGSMYASPSFITPGQEVKLTANFPSDQSFVDVTFFTKVGADLTPIGSDESNKYGNAYLTDHQVDAEHDIVALTPKGVCTPTITITPTEIDPETLPEDGSLYTDPTSIREGRTATIVANFPSGNFDVTAFQKKNGEWQAIGTDRSNSYGNAYIPEHKFDGTETIVAVTSDGRRTNIRDIETVPPNVVSGGPSTLGKNIVYVTTDSGATPKTKGVDYKGKAVLESDGEPTETLDVDTIAVRGNSSATKAKKPYKLKFEDKQKPFGMKSDKTWILLANYGDWTLVRSMVAWDLGKLLPEGLRWTPDSRFAELFLNGKYMGSYQMVQSIKIDGNRVDVDKETGQVIEFDPHWKTDGVPGMVGKSGVNYAWKDPDEFKTLDEEDGGGEDPEGLTNAKINKMKDKIRAFEDVLYGPEGNRNWATYNPPSPAVDWTTYLDMNSAVDYYLAREFTKDNDADMYRSNYFYTNNVDPSSPDKFFLGPIWDFDRSAGAKDEDGSTSISEPTGWWMRGNGSQNHDTNKIHWYTRITDDPRFLAALDERWAETRQHFEAVGPHGVSTAVRKLGGGDGEPSDSDYELGKQVAANDRKIWSSYGGRYHAKTSTYTGELSWVRNWYSERFEWMDDQLTD